jgi:hypothetical protein
MMGDELRRLRGENDRLIGENGLLNREVKRLKGQRAVLCNHLFVAWNNNLPTSQPQQRLNEPLQILAEEATTMGPKAAQQVSELAHRIEEHNEANEEESQQNEDPLQVELEQDEPEQVVGVDELKQGVDYNLIY